MLRIYPSGEPGCSASDALLVPQAQTRGHRVGQVVWVFPSVQEAHRPTQAQAWPCEIISMENGVWSGEFMVRLLGQPSHAVLEAGLEDVVGFGAAFACYHACSRAPAFQAAIAEAAMKLSRRGVLRQEDILSLIHI